MWEVSSYANQINTGRTVKSEKYNKKSLSHTDNQGKANMVDIGHKPIQQRSATAAGFIMLQQDTLKLIRENLVKKGDVLTVAEIAGIQAAKQTSSLIPLCHPLQLTNVKVTARLVDEAFRQETSARAGREPLKVTEPAVKEQLRQGVEVTATVACNGMTGVEMEALTAVSAALLTIYDMCKAVDKQMEIGNIVLLEKKKV